MRLTDLFLIVLTISLTGCKDKFCQIDYVHFERRDAPLIYIIERKDHCIYLFEGQFWFEKHSVISEGEMIFEDNAIHLIIERINSSRIKYFDFSKNIGEPYKIVYDKKDSSLASSIAFTAKIDQVFSSRDGMNVFVFRVADGFIHQEVGNGYRADLVYFVTKENGVIGSYISRLEGNTEMVIHRKGNIFEDVIDYSKREFRNLN